MGLRLRRLRLLLRAKATCRSEKLNYNSRAGSLSTFGPVKWPRPGYLLDGRGDTDSTLRISVSIKRPCRCVSLPAPAGDYRAFSALPHAVT
jgi:hypothetical protein